MRDASTDDRPTRSQIRDGKSLDLAERLTALKRRQAAAAQVAFLGSPFGQFCLSVLLAVPLSAQNVLLSQFPLRRRALDHPHIQRLHLLTCLFRSSAVVLRLAEGAAVPPQVICTIVVSLDHNHPAASSILTPTQPRRLHLCQRPLVERSRLSRRRLPLCGAVLGPRHLSTLLL